MNHKFNYLVVQNGFGKEGVQYISSEPYKVCEKLRSIFDLDAEAIRRWYQNKENDAAKLENREPKLLSKLIYERKNPNDIFYPAWGARNDTWPDSIIIRGAICFCSTVEILLFVNGEPHSWGDWPELLNLFSDNEINWRQQHEN